MSTGDTRDRNRVQEGDIPTHIEIARERELLAGLGIALAVGRAT